MKKRHKITNRTFVLTAAIGSLMIIAVVIINTLISTKKTMTATSEAVSAVSSFYLEAMADRRAKTITNLINNNFDMMEKALPFFYDDRIKTQDDLRNMIGRMTDLMSLSRLALVDEDNVVYTQYTTYTGGSRHEFLAKDKMDDRTVSTVYLYGSSKELCLAIPTHDLTILNKKFKACFVQIDIKDITNLLAFDDQGRTYYALYSKNGSNLTDTKLGPVIADSNLFDATKDILSADVRKDFIDHFSNADSGSITYTYDGTEETLCYVPVPDTDWEVAVLIRENIIRDQIRGISDKFISRGKQQIFNVLLSALIFAAILMLELRSISHNRLAAEKENSLRFLSMANTDSMTGVRNKHAFTDAEAAVNHKLQENEIDQLMLLVFDVNGLKHINDTKGHAAGDKLIKDAAAMISKYFIHGSIFRIGGDEFVALIQDKSYDKTKEDIDAFNKQTEANIKTEDVVISLGYATLEEGDLQLRDMFERADQMMYERKKSLKSMGAKTRS